MNLETSEKNKKQKNPSWLQNPDQILDQQLQVCEYQTNISSPALSEILNPVWMRWEKKHFDMKGWINEEV